MSETISDGLTLTIPSSGAVNWEAEFRTFAEAISAHDHTGSGLGAQLNQDAVSLTWTSWTPTITASGAMTIGSTVITYAKYCRMGSMVFIKARATFTTGGTANTDVIFTLPVNISTDGEVLAAAVSDPSGLAGFAQRNSSTTIYVRRYDSANWSLGASRGFFVNGFYEAA